MTSDGGFTSDNLLTAASTRCGLTNFGDDHFRAGLDRFVDACRSDGFVPVAGLASIGETIIKILVNRLRFEETLTRHPEILDQTIVSPLVIIGPGRVGSTKLHRLLANAANIQTTPLWQVMNPIPAIGAKDGEPDPRIRVAEDFCESIKVDVPQLYAAIEPIATAPDEDPYMMDMTFMQLMFLALANVPSYVHWIYQQDWLEPNAAQGPLAHPAHGYAVQVVSGCQVRTDSSRSGDVCGLNGEGRMAFAYTPDGQRDRHSGGLRRYAAILYAALPPGEPANPGGASGNTNPGFLLRRRTR
jgi:hypothetical protein